MDGWGLPIGVQEKRGYKARPLDGIWGTPPFLHNGSVPTLFELLSPVYERRSEFWVGNHEYDPARVGYGVKAIVGITAAQPGKQRLLAKLAQTPQVLECHHVAGADSYLMTVVARDLPDLERFLGTINGYGETRTSIVFSTPIPRRGLVPPGA